MIRSREHRTGWSGVTADSHEETQIMAAGGGDPVAELSALRQSIDNIDMALVAMLAERFRCTKAVGELKARYKMPPADPDREARQIARLRELARNARLDPDFAEKFLNFIIREVIRHHEAIARDDAAHADVARESAAVEARP